MIYAKDQSGERIEPWPGAKAECPTCGGEVIAKCGSTNRWHWSHRGDTDCDPWGEHEGPWHLAWKDYFAPSEREVVIGPHRADIRTKAGRVIELQHSPISAEEIREREEFYGRGMVWVVDASVFWANVDFVFYPSNWRKFQWRWSRKCWTAAIRPIYFDAGGGRLFRVQQFDTNARYGYGNWGCKYEWLRFFGSHATLNKDPIERLHAMHERGTYAAR